jgi:hypothetical protein
METKENVGIRIIMGVPGMREIREIGEGESVHTDKKDINARFSSEIEWSDTGILLRRTLSNLGIYSVGYSVSHPDSVILSLFIGEVRNIKMEEGVSTQGRGQYEVLEKYLIPRSSGLSYTKNNVKITVEVPKKD